MGIFGTELASDEASEARLPDVPALDSPAMLLAALEERLEYEEVWMG
jgi:hypothetical protein